MIFVTLGTQDKPFTRLLETIEHALCEGVIQEEVIVQSGYTAFTSKHMRLLTYCDQQQFQHYMEEARIVITHGGVGTIMTGLQMGKTMIAAARLAQYHEHHNNHQTQLLEAFEKAGYLLYIKDFTTFQQVYEKAQVFHPCKFESNQAHFLAMIDSFIQANASLK